MLGRDLLHFFYFKNNNQKLGFIDRGINHSDLTLKPIIDYVRENKPECLLYHYVTEATVEWVSNCYSLDGTFKLSDEYYELEKTLLENNCKFYLILGCHYPDLYKPFIGKVQNFEILYWPTYLILHTYSGLKDLYLSPRELDGKIKVDTLSVEKNFEKLYINYNHKPRYHRCIMIDELYRNGLFDVGINSWNVLSGKIGAWDILLGEKRIHKFKYWTESIMNIDNYKFENKEFKDEYSDLILNPKAFMCLVGESSMDLPFVTEKTYRPILIEQPFLCYGAKNQNKEILKFGFQLYDEIFDYDFDSKENLVDRINGIIDNLNNLRSKNYYELYELIKPKLEYNKKRAIEIIHNDTFNPYFEFYEKYLKTDSEEEN